MQTTRHNMLWPEILRVMNETDQFMESQNHSAFHEQLFSSSNSAQLLNSKNSVVEIKPNKQIISSVKIKGCNAEGNLSIENINYDKLANTALQTIASGKFEFKYSNSNLKLEEKMIEEDNYALAVLTNSKQQQAVTNIAKRLANYLETIYTDQPNVIDGVRIGTKYGFIETIESFLMMSKGNYPIAYLKLDTFEDLLSFLKNEADSIKLLSIMWTVFSSTSHGRNGVINNVYGNKILPTKDYTQDNKNKKAHNGTVQQFGSSGKVCADIFSDAKFHPFARSTDYIQLNQNSDNKIVQKFINTNTPYVSGLSGMANLTCKILNNLNLNPFAENNEARKFCEAMAAFIVGSGMHSYKEVYKTFNLYKKIE